MGAGVGEDAVGMHGADDRKAVFRLGVVDRVAARDERTGGAHDVGPAVENPSEQLERQVLTRPRHQVQRQQRRAAHRVHVRESVRGRDAAPVVRVVDDGSEEVRRDDDGEVVPQPVDGGVVGGVESDEQFGIGVGPGGCVEPAHQAQHRAQVGGRQLAGAARAVRVARQADGLGSRHQPMLRPAGGVSS